MRAELRGVRRRAPTAVCAFLVAAGLAACGILTPTPARFRPPLPDPQQMHDVLAEDVVAELEARGFDCSFNPGGGDVDATSWSCYLGELDAGDYLNVGIASADTGPIDSMGPIAQ